MRNRNMSCIYRIIVSDKYRIKTNITKKLKNRKCINKESKHRNKHSSNSRNITSMQANKQINKEQIIKTQKLVCTATA